MPQRRRPQDLEGRFQCPECGEFKYPEEFYANIRTIDGISTYCKPCHKARQRNEYSPTARARKEKERADAAEAALAEQLVAYQTQVASEAAPFDAAALELGESMTFITGGMQFEVTRLPDPEFDPILRGQYLFERYGLNVDMEEYETWSKEDQDAWYEVAQVSMDGRYKR